MSLHTSRRAALLASLCAFLAGSSAFVPDASASNVAWNVSVGGPGFAVSAGQPGFRTVGPWGRCVGCGWNRTWFPPIAPAPIFFAPPVFAPVVPLPVVATVVVRPRRFFVPAPVFVRRGW